MRSKVKHVCIYIFYAVCFFVLVAIIVYRLAFQFTFTINKTYYLLNLIIMLGGLIIHETGHIIVALLFGGRSTGLRLSDNKKMPGLKVSIMLPNFIENKEHFFICWGGLLFPCLFMGIVLLIKPTAVVFFDMLIWVTVLNILPLKILRNDGYKASELFYSDKARKLYIGINFFFVAVFATLYVYAFLKNLYM